MEGNQVLLQFSVVRYELPRGSHFLAVLSSYLYKQIIWGFCSYAVTSLLAEFGEGFK